MRIFSQDITLLEVPGEVSLSFGVPGCTQNCPGCQWKSLDTTGQELPLDKYISLLKDNQGFATCVVFLGGDQYVDLPEYLQVAKEYGYKTCLYTGKNEVSEELKALLDFIKYGEYLEALGALASRTTNQRFINNNTGEDMTHLFWKGQ